MNFSTLCLAVVATWPLVLMLLSLGTDPRRAAPATDACLPDRPREKETS